MSNMIDLTGQRFGMWVVLEKAPKSGKQIKWRCRCDCGNERNVFGENLRRGLSKSCGCTMAEEFSKRNRTHGETRTRLYRTWSNMCSRCYNPNVFAYPYYGGRGISVCDEWRHSYEAFRDWALANGYREDLTIERKNTDENYCPENCRWATRFEQANNKRNNRLVEFNGQSKSVAAWAHELGMDHRALWDRLFVQGWSVERALTTPPRG